MAKYQVLENRKNGRVCWTEMLLKQNFTNYKQVFDTKWYYNPKNKSQEDTGHKEIRRSLCSLYENLVFGGLMNKIGNLIPHFTP